MQLVELLLLAENCYLLSLTEEQEADGHFVSFHMVTGQWYRIDDSSRCRPFNDPILQKIPAETVDVLFFKSDF